MNLVIVRSGVGVTFADRRRLPNETDAQEFGNALDRLVAKAYPSVDDQTQGMFARDQFMTYFPIYQFGSLALVADFLLLDVPSCDVLFGFDFLSKFGAMIDRFSSCMGKTLPLLVPDDPAKPHTVVIKSDTVIPTVRLYNFPVCS